MSLVSTDIKISACTSTGLPVFCINYSASTRVSLLPQSDQSSLRLDNESGTYSRNSQHTDGTINRAIKKLVSIKDDKLNEEARLNQTSTAGNHTNRDSLTTKASTYKLLTAETHSTIATDFAHSTFINSGNVILYTLLIYFNIDNFYTLH